MVLFGMETVIRSDVLKCEIYTVNYDRSLRYFARYVTVVTSCS